MFRRNAKFVSAVFAGFLAATSLTAISYSTASAADDCLSGPKEHTPEGGHWYYRIDHASKRHCWYLREEDEKLSQTAAPNSSPSAKPVAPQPAATMQPAVADARAELTPHARVEMPNLAPTSAPAMPADAAPAQPSLVASRWPDPYSTTASAEAAEVAPAKRDAVESAGSTPAQPALGAEPIAVADASTASPAYSVRLQLAALAAVLALAGLVGVVVFRVVGARRPAKAKIRRDRSAIWQPTDDDRIRLSADPETHALPRRRGFARDLDRANGHNERVTEFFAQLSKRTPS